MGNEDSTSNEHPTVDATPVNPTRRFPRISPPEQHQSQPGLDSKLEPLADLGEDSYVGSGKLAGRRALITGADSGIGAAVAIAFAREGADIAMAYLPVEESDAQRVALIIEATGRSAHLFPGDLLDDSYRTQLVAWAAEALGGLDILVNNAGKQVSVEKLEDLDDDQLLATYRVNILSMFSLSRDALEHLSPGSSIINTTSIQAYDPSPHLLDYASTKAAINNFTKGLAAQLAPRGIRVNAVAPGPIWTPLQPSSGQPIEALPEFGHDTPLGRAGQPAELAPAYVFLASAESSYVLGETLNVNGGKASP